MKTTNLKLLILPLLLVSQMAQAQNESPDFFNDVVGKRVQTCKSHFDVEPFLVAAMGATDDPRFTPELRASVEKFGQTGRLTIPASKMKDPLAHTCAAYAEGMLVGSISYQLGQAIGTAIGEFLGQAIQKMFEGLGQDLSQPPKGGGLK